MPDFAASAKARSVAFGSLSGGAEPRRKAGRGRLLSSLYRAISHDPERILVLRPQAPEHKGLRWIITEAPALTQRDLIIQRPGFADVTIGLDGATIAQVRDGLLFAGVPLAYVTTDAQLLARSALALIPGSGEAWQSNGDHIHAFRAPLWAWADPLGRWLDQARADIAEMLRMLVVRQSGGQWSELWGSYFGLQRRPGETDAKLNRRTEWEWRRPRSNPKAMELNIKVLLDQDVEVREPWREMMVVSGSVLSGGDHLPNEAEFAYHRAQLRSSTVYDWTPAMVEAEADRPAGTLLIDPVTLPAAWSIDATQTRIAFGAAPAFSARIQEFDGQIISVNWDLSDTYVLLNPTIAIAEEMDFISEPRVTGGDIGNHLTISKGEIVASEQWPLGDVQNHLSGRQLVEIGTGLIASGDTALSDYSNRLEWQPIDEWILDERGLATPAPFSMPAQQPMANEQGVGGTIVSAGAATDLGAESVQALTGGTAYAYAGGWRGRWDSRKWAAGYPRPLLAFAASNSLPDGSGAKSISTATASLSAQTRFAAAAISRAGGPAPALATGILLQANIAAEASALVTFGAKHFLAASASASPAALADMSGGIRLVAGIAAQASAAPAQLQTAITLTAQVLSPALASGRLLGDLAALAASSSSAQASLQTAANISASAQASPSAAADLRVSKRFNAAVGGLAQASGDLATQAFFSAQAAGSSAATASLAAGVRMVASAVSQSSLLVASLVGQPLFTAAAKSVAAASASLLIGRRFVGTGFVNASASAGLTATGPQYWPAAGRTWLFDPDNDAKTILDTGRVSALYEVGGSDPHYFYQTYTPARPALATVSGRRFLDINGGLRNLDSSGPVTETFSNLSAAATYHVVWRSPAVLWDDVIPLLGATSGDLSQSAMMALDDAYTSTPRQMLDVRGNGNSYFNRSGAPAWQTNTTYLLTYRRNADGSMSFFIDGVKQSTFGSPVPPGAVLTGVGGMVGTYWTAVSAETDAGYIGAFMRYDTAQSDSDVATMASIKASRYGGAGGVVAERQTYSALASTTSDAFISDTRSWVLGNKMRFSRAGTITHLRYWRERSDQTIDGIKLWKGDGTELARVEAPDWAGAAGWVQIALPQPMDVDAGLYVVSYRSSGPGYPRTTGRLVNAVTSGPVTFPANDAADGGNGVGSIIDYHGFPIYGNGGDSFMTDVVFY